MVRKAISIAVSKAISKPLAFEGEPQTFTKEQVDAAVKAAIEKEVGGLKSNNAALLEEKKKLQDDLGKIKQTLTAFEGVDVKEYKELMSYFQTNEEARLIKDGKIDQVIEARTARVIAEANKKAEALQKEVDAEKQRGQKYRQRVMDDSLRAAAMEAGVHKQAVDDILLHGRQLFTLDDEGNTVQVKDGATVIGSDGKTPFGPLEWLKGSQEAKPHWWPADASGSAAAARKQGGDGSKPTLKRAQFTAMSTDQRAEAVKKYQIVD